MNRLQRVGLTTLGCKTNQFETAAMTEQLHREGYVVVPFDEEADIYIINTCTVTSRTDSESRRIIRRARRRSPEARIVVTGCFAQVSPDEVAALAEVDLVIGNAEKRNLVELLRVAGGARVLVSPAEAADRSQPLALESFAEHTRAFLQIQNGCNSFCSYCIVPYARGRSRSVSFTDAVEGIRRFARKGFQEVVLTGIHLGSYGFDLAPASSLAELVRYVDREALVPRLRLGSVEPLDLSDDLIDAISSAKSFCPHLHIPLQSGSDTVLSRMSRQYTSRVYAALIGNIAARIPGVFLGTDVIVGFPGETDAEFTETYDLIASLPLAHLHVFPFSRRQGTPAADMPGQVAPATIKKRAEMLRMLSEQKKDAFAATFVGRTLSVLLQKPTAGGVITGLSRNYLSVHMDKAPGDLAGEHEVVITGCTTGILTGHLQVPR